MAWVGVAAASALIVVIFIDTFEMLILPRRVKHSFRLGRLFYRSTWRLWQIAARQSPPGPWRNSFLSIFGPLSLFGLMFVWATGLIFGFAFLHWSLDTSLAFGHRPDDDFLTYLYFSGTTFFTLGYGDVVPTGLLGRGLSVAEAGIGFGFLAIVISYLPVLYQAFSRREITISLMDARAGSPPTAGELLRRLAEARAAAGAGAMLAEWERWSAELLETHLSYPVLSYYRSQHDNQSWVATLTAILDTSALLIAGVGGSHGHQARLTFAMARHAAVDLSMVTQRPPMPPDPDRLPKADLCRLLSVLRGAGMEIRDEQAVAAAVAELRLLYEPFVNALAAHFLFELPGFQPTKPPVDNWQTTPWTPRSPDLGGLPAAAADHDRVH
jgi:Ion channel